MLQNTTGIQSKTCRRLVWACGFQSKFKHLWDAAERSVRSAEPVRPPLTQGGQSSNPPGPLEQALSAKPGAFADNSVSGSERADAESMQQDGLQSKMSGVQAGRSSIVGTQSMSKQGSTMMRLTGRLSSLFPSMKSNADEYQQNEDDLSGLVTCTGTIDCLCKILMPMQTL